MKNEQQTKELLDKINECCGFYIGTHNFHNYSKTLRAKDPQSQRYIIQFYAEQLDEENVIFNIVGQSFIYHQIRKMIGCVIKVILNREPPSYIENTFFRNQITIPLAPANGLYLNSLHFDSYNKKKDIPQILSFDQVETIPEMKAKINEFIVNQDKSQWMEWIVKLRESIYHGRQFNG